MAPRHHPALGLLEENHAALRDEAAAMRQRMFAWNNTGLYKSGWFVGPLYSHTQRVRGRFARECHQTMALLDRLMAEDELGLVTAGFSCLAPGAETHLHRNDDGYAWRVHIGLDIPEGDVGLEVDGKQYRWEAGRSIVWDPTLPHRAWNHSDRDRTILLLDFFRPEHPRAEMRALMQRITASRRAANADSRGFTGQRV